MVKRIPTKKFSKSSEQLFDQIHLNLSNDGVTLHVTQCHVTEDGTTKIMAHVLILPVWTNVVSHNEATYVVFAVFPVSQTLDLTAPCCFSFVHTHFLLSIVCENNPLEYIKLICIFTHKNKRYGYN